MKHPLRCHKLCWLVFCYLLPFATHAGTPDSLAAALRNPQLPDTTRVLVLAALAPTYRNVNNDTLLTIAQRGIALAKKISYARGEAICSLQLAIGHISNNDYGQGHKIATEVRTFLAKNGNSPELCDVLHWIGIGFQFQTKLDSALACFEAAGAIAAALHDADRMGKEHYYIAGVHNDQGNFSQALEHYLKSQKFYEQAGNTSQGSSIMADISMLYVQLKDTAKAYEYLNKTVTALPQINNTQSLFASMCNVAITYGMLRQHQKALAIFERGYHIADSSGNAYWKNIFLANKAEVYTSTMQYEHAVAAYLLMQENNERAKDINVEMAIESGLGRIYYSQGNAKEGLKHMENAFGIVTTHGMKRMAMEMAEDLARLNEEQGNYRKALYYSKEY